MNAWRMAGVGLGMAATACFVEFEERPVYEVDTGVTASSETSTSSDGSGGDSSNSNSSSNSDDDSSNTSSSSNGSGGDGNTSSNSSGGNGGSPSSNVGTGGSANNGTGGGTTTNTNGGAPSTTSNGTGGEPSTTGGGNGGSGGAMDLCDDTDASCSACNTFTCVQFSNCCSGVSFFAAQATPEWVEMPELVTNFDESNSVTLDVAFTANGQVAAIAYILSSSVLLDYALTIDATVSGGWTLTVSLEDTSTGSGCVYTTGNIVEAYDYPDNCWGDWEGYLLTPWDLIFNQINVRLESVSSGAGEGSLTINEMVLE